MAIIDINKPSREAIREVYMKGGVSKKDAYAAALAIYPVAKRDLPFELLKPVAS